MLLLLLQKLSPACHRASARCPSASAHRPRQQLPPVSVVVGPTWFVSFRYYVQWFNKSYPRQNYRNSHFFQYRHLRRAAYDAAFSARFLEGPTHNEASNDRREKAMSTTAAGRAESGNFMHVKRRLRRRCERHGCGSQASGLITIDDDIRRMRHPEPLCFLKAPLARRGFIRGFVTKKTAPAWPTGGPPPGTGTTSGPTPRPPSPGPPGIAAAAAASGAAAAAAHGGGAGPIGRDRPGRDRPERRRRRMPTMMIRPLRLRLLVRRM